MPLNNCTGIGNAISILQVEWQGIEDIQQSAPERCITQYKRTTFLRGKNLKKIFLMYGLFHCQGRAERQREIFHLLFRCPNANCQFQAKSKPAVPEHTPGLPHVCQWPKCLHHYLLLSRVYISREIWEGSPDSLTWGLDVPRGISSTVPNACSQGALLSSWRKASQWIHTSIQVCWGAHLAETEFSGPITVLLLLAGSPAGPWGARREGADHTRSCGFSHHGAFV